MKKFAMILAVVGILWGTPGVAWANEVTLQFDPNDIFNYATVDDTRLNQQGTARYIWNTPTSREYRTYNDATRDSGATAAKDLQSVANILDWTATAGYQGTSHVQLWLCNGKGSDWGETVVMKRNTTISASVNGEYNAALDSDLVPGQQYTIWFNAANNNWRCEDDYGNDEWGSPNIQGTIMATAVPEPGTMTLLGIGAIGLLVWRRRRA